MKLKKVTALITALTLVFSFATITALAQWIEDTETPTVEVVQGDTPPDNGDGYEWRLVEIRVEQGGEINGRYEEREINGRFVDVEVNGREVEIEINRREVQVEELGHFENICLGYEKTYASPGVRLTDIVDDSDNSGSYSGTPENVGPVVKGDVLLCKLDGLADMSIKIV